MRNLSQNRNIFISYISELFLSQGSQLALTFYSFKYLSNDLFYSIGLIQIFISSGIIYYDSGIYTLSKSQKYSKSRIRNTILSVSVYRFLFSYMLFFLFVVISHFVGEFCFNTHFYILIFYIPVVFFSNFLVNICEAMGLLAKITFVKSSLTALITLGTTVVIYYFRSDFIYIAYLYFVQLTIILYILVNIGIDFKLQTFKFWSLFCLNDRFKFSKNNLYISFLVENTFLALNYISNQQVDNTALFYKIDKYLKLFFGLIVGFYQRTLFYIQLRNDLNFSIIPSLFLFVIICLSGLYPLFLILNTIQSFSSVLFFKLSLFYISIYSIVFLNILNVITKSRRMLFYLNGVLAIILLLYVYLTLML